MAYTSQLIGNEIELTPALATEYALAGIDALDAEFGGADWRNEINLETLDMRSAEDCMLGQMFGNYLDAPAMLRSLPYFGGHAVARVLHVNVLSRSRMALIHSILTDAYAAALESLARPTV